MHIAQINIAKLLYPKDSEEVIGFTGNIDRINELAQASKGYIWHLEDSFAGKNYYEDKTMLINISIWTSIEDFRKFVFGDEHLHFMKNKAKWFTRPTAKVNAIWHTNKRKDITVEEGMKRLESLNKSGPSHYAFSLADKQFYVNSSS